MSFTLFLFVFLVSLVIGFILGCLFTRKNGLLTEAAVLDAQQVAREIKEDSDKIIENLKAELKLYQAKQLSEPSNLAKKRAKKKLD